MTMLWYIIKYFICCLKPITKTTIVFYDGGYDEKIKNRNVIKTKILNVK